MKLLRSYTSLSYEFFLTHNSADLIRKIISDVNNLVTGVLLAGSQFLSQLIVSSTILGLLLVIQPWVAIAAFAFSASLGSICVELCSGLFASSTHQLRARPAALVAIPRLRV